MSRKFYRVSATPGKTLLWLWVKQDLAKMKGELGVDLAGGSMLNKRFFRTNKYASVDINQVKLDEGKSKNPDAIAFNCRIQEFLEDPHREKPDVFVCVQTMGTNGFFEHEETFEIVRSMHESLNTGGSMLFNIGTVGVDLDELERQLNLFFEGRFAVVKRRFYGAMHLGQANKQSRWQRTQAGISKRTEDSPDHDKPRSNPRLALGLGLAFIMNLVPPLRTSFGSRRKKLYYCCRGKL